MAAESIMGARAARLLGVTIFLAVGGGLAAPSASAALLTDLNSNGRIDLGDAILTSSGGFTVGDVRFSHFQYTPTSTVAPGSPGGAPLAADVAVDAVNVGTGNNYGLRFGFGWFSINGFSMDSRITYTVTLLDPNPLQLIDQVGLTFNGTSLNVAGAAVAETIYDATGIQTPAHYLGGLAVFGDPDGSGPNVGDQVDTLDLLPNQRSITVVKDIQVFSAPVLSAGPNNVSTISFVDNTYRQTVAAVPEPAGLAGLALLGMALQRRRR